jgi:hypothetical protein
MRVNALAKLLNVNKDDLNVFVAKADGDCFYECIKHVLDIDIQILRNLVALQFTEEIYDNYKAICDFSDDLMWIRRCKSLYEAKSLLQLKKLVWADEYALKVIVETYSLTLFIINEGNRDSSTSFDRIGNGQTHIILNRTRRQHYNLIKFVTDVSPIVYDQFVHRNI